MAGRGRTSFQKRQKEQVRLERRQAKAARKDARKTSSDEAGNDIMSASEFLGESSDAASKFAGGPELQAPDQH